jgi:hypothetical protein
MPTQARNHVNLRCGSFQVDVSPPIGHALCGGLAPPARGQRDPLFARGLILDDGKTRVLTCAVDYCCLVGEAHRQVVRVLARGAGIAPGCVALHTVHQHDAPYVHLEAEPLLKRQGIGQIDEAWWEAMVKKLGRAAASVRRLQRVTAVGVGEARVTGCASNRRLIGRNGRVQAMRLSMTTDPALQAWPVGLIDPLLRTITLWNGRKLLASLNYYACHPQSAWRRGLISADSIGEALRLTREQFPAAFHLYFNGCGANITFGKFATKNPEANIRLFGSRIADGIVRGIRHSETTRVAPGPLLWRSRPVHLPVQVRLSRAQAERWLISPRQPLPMRAFAAWALEAGARRQRWGRVKVQSLRLGPAWIVHLPAEVFVEYQLYAQALRPEEFVAIAAYGEGGMLYLPTAEAFRQGGYEVDALSSYSTPATEPLLKAALRRALEIR